MTDKKNKGDFTSIEELGEFEHVDSTAFTDFTLEETASSDNPESNDLSDIDFGGTDFTVESTTEETPEETKEDPVFTFPDEMEEKTEELTANPDPTPEDLP